MCRYKVNADAWKEGNIIKWGYKDENLRISLVRVRIGKLEVN